MDSDLHAADASIQDFPDNYNDRGAILPSSDQDEDSRRSSPSHANSEGKVVCSDDDITVKDMPTGPTIFTHHRNYSVLRARVVSSILLILHSMGAPSHIVTSQYLRHRMLREAEIHAGDLGNKTVCGVTGSKNFSDPIIQTEDDVQSRATILGLYLSYCVSFPAILTCLLLGSYGDVLGRRAVLLSPLLGSLINLTLIFFIMRFDLDINLLFIGSLVDGLSGSSHCIRLAAFSITVDLDINKSNRTIWIVILDGMNKITMSSAIAITGVLIKQFDYSVAILFIVVPGAAGILLGFFLMPETRPEVVERTKYNPCVHMKRTFTMFFSDGKSRNRKALFMALALFFLSSFNNIHKSIITLYQMHEPFCWDSTIVGYYAAYSNIAQVIIGTIFLKALQLLFSIRNDIIAQISTLFQIAASVMQGIINTTWEYFLVPIVAGPFFVTSGVLRSVMSFLVGQQKQGAMFASIAVMEIICNILTTTTLSEVYSATVSTFPGLIFLLAAGIAVITFFTYFIFFRFYDDPTKQDAQKDQVLAPKDHRNKVSNKDYNETEA